MEGSDLAVVLAAATTGIFGLAGIIASQVLAKRKVAKLKREVQGEEVSPNVHVHSFLQNSLQDQEIHIKSLERTVKLQCLEIKYSLESLELKVSSLENKIGTFVGREGPN